MSRPGVTCRPYLVLAVPTRSLLRAYVSSHKTDMFTCNSDRTDSFLTPPYACAYTHAAKRGGVPHLAVATEQGTVYVWDTSKREELGGEPNRIDLDIHENGIFDLQWSSDDTSLVTCSGDHTARITDISTGKVLHILRGHTSTVKTVLLSTGGRDGGIRVWDLRMTDRNVHGQTSHAPVTVIDGAHGEDKQTNRGGRRKLPHRTNDQLISSGSFDGVLRLWDLRHQPNYSSQVQKKRAVQPVTMSAFDPTIVEGARRARGLTSVVAGTGATCGLLFGLAPKYAHQLFLGTLALSPDGRSLLSGSSGTDKGASAFLFDVSQTALAASPILPDSAGVELPGQKGEVGGVDWAQDMLATCSDDGTVRVWRFDPGIRQQCDSEPDARWNWTWGVDSL
ncbi:WD40-repeat-containing domain protein [Lactifluus volemus]|nr:WD40-repeat-containing domain protein [Lactifluus volemus]